MPAPKHRLWSHCSLGRTQLFKSIGGAQTGASSIPLQSQSQKRRLSAHLPWRATMNKLPVQTRYVWILGLPCVMQVCKGSPSTGKSNIAAHCTVLLECETTPGACRGVSGMVQLWSGSKTRFLNAFLLLKCNENSEILNHNLYKRIQDANLKNKGLNVLFLRSPTAFLSNLLR